MAGLTFRLGQLPDALQTDTSNNVGIGAAPSGSYKLEVTGSGRFSSTLLVSGALTSASEILSSGGQLALSGSGSVPSTGIGIRYNGTFYVYAGANGFNIRKNDNSANNLTIADSGAATFSSTITSGGTVSVNPSSVGFLTLGASANYGSVSSGGGGATLYLNGATRGGTGGATSSCVTLATDSFFQITDGSTNNFKFFVRGDGAFYTGNGSNSPRNSTTGNASNVFIDDTDSGRLYRSTSSLKYKIDVKDYDKGLNEVLQMRPVYYKGKNDGETQFAGLIAEEIHDLGLTEFVQYAKDGTPDALAYSNMIALLTKAIQELNERLNKAGL